MAIEGWSIEGIGTSASEPVEPGDSIPVTVSASNFDDEDESVEFSVSVNGTEEATARFEAAQTGIDESTVDLTVPDTEFMEVSIADEEELFNTTVSGTGDNEVLTLEAPGEAAVDSTVEISAEVGCTGGGDDSPCEESTVSLEAEDSTLASQTVDLDVAETVWVSAETAFDSSGTVSVSASVDDSSKSTTIDVTSDGDGGG